MIEVKTELTSIEETLRRHDQKTRLASAIAEKRFGWQARSVGRLLVLPDESTARRRVRRYDGLLRRTYPLRGRALRAWLRGPSGAAAGVFFLVSDRRGWCSLRSGDGGDYRRDPASLALAGPRIMGG